MITYFVAHPGYKPEALNKIIGCKSRTVPPLCVLIPRSFGESQSLSKSWEGRIGVRKQSIRKA